MTIIAEDDPRLVFVPLEQATVPPAGLIEHLRNRWWNAHPTKGLIFWGKQMAPQCNLSEVVAKRFQAEMYPWAEVLFVPSVFRRVDVLDYAP